MGKLREEFEKLPEIKTRLERNGGGYFVESRGNYHHSFPYFEMYINGAWYIYQQKKNKIDDILNLVCKLQYSSGDRIFKEVEELINESK